MTVPLQTSHIVVKDDAVEKNGRKGSIESVLVIPTKAAIPRIRGEGDERRSVVGRTRERNPLEEMGREKKGQVQRGRKKPQEGNLYNHGTHVSIR